MGKEGRKGNGLQAEVLRLREHVRELEASQANFLEIEERFRCLYERSPECIYIQSLDGTFLDANQPALDLFGYTRGELLKLDLTVLLGEHQLPLTRAIREEILRDGHQGHAAEYCLRRKNGEMLCVEACAAPLYRDGRPYALLGVVKDITECNAYEKALQESERNFRALAENANACILVITGEDGIIIYANRMASELSGYTPSELDRKPVDEVLHPEVYVRLMERYDKIVNGKTFPRRYETEMIFQNGRHFPAEIVSARTFWHAEAADMVIVHDITERIRIEEEKKAILREKAEIVDTMGDGLLVANMRGIIVNTNPAYERMSGLPRAEIIGSYCLDLAARTMGRKDLDLITRNFPAALRGNPLPILSCTIVREDGRQTPLSFTTSYTRDNDGKPRSMILVLKDMTERKLREDALREAQTNLQRRVMERTRKLKESNAKLRQEAKKNRRIEQALIESEALFRSLVENLNDIIFRIDTHGVFTYVSSAVEQVSGYTPAEIIGREVFEFVQPEDSSLIRTRIVKSLRGESVIGEYRVDHKHGQPCWIQTSTHTIKTGGRVVGLQGIITDITAQKIFQDRFILPERQAATGQLIASIAHEINAPLKTISNTSSAIRNKPPEDDILMGHVDLPHEDFENIRDTVRKLLDHKGQKASS